MTKRQGRSGTIDVKALLSEDEEFLRALVRTALQEVLEAEMREALGAEKAGRQGYRSGYYGRTLITRVGKLELRVPQDRTGRFSTELFERYQRSERALVAALAEMYGATEGRSGGSREKRPARLFVPRPRLRFGGRGALWPQQLSDGDEDGSRKCEAVRHRRSSRVVFATASVSRSSCGHLARRRRRC